MVLVEFCHCLGNEKEEKPGEKNNFGCTSS